MNEIIQKVCERTGMGEEQARKAVETVVEHLRQVLPGPIAAQLDSFLGEGAPAGQQTEGGIAGMFGKL
jgi:hypothetical protein